MMEEETLARLIRLRRYEELDREVDRFLREYGWSEILHRIEGIKPPNLLDPTLDVGYLEGYEEKDYEIRTPYSWFTLLHEFVHICLKELDYPDDERLAYVIPAGIFYFYKYYNNRRESLEGFT